MENIEKTMTHEQSLQLIQSMINTARNKVAEDGFHLIMWGILVILASLANYIMAISSYGALGYIPWIIMPVIGVPLGIWYGRSRRGMGHVSTLVDIHVGYMWWAYSVALFLAIAYSVAVQVSPIPYILLITGMVTFASGLMLQFRPLMSGGVVFWILTVICFFVRPVDQLLLEVIGVSLGYIVPGLMLRHKAKLENHV